jgi:heme/copper-type cytochrome/quinol oxidase subunit 2
VIIASFQDYLPVSDLLRIVAVCLAVAIVAPAAAALVITGFEAQASADESGRSRTSGDVRIALGVVVVVAMIIVGLYAMSDK